MADNARAASDCGRLLEALTSGDPVPDTAALCPDREALVALLAELCRGERSVWLPQLTAVGQRRGLSVQALAARAGFLLACLDLPGEEDAYALLGVPPTATPQEIRAAWIARLSRYHPDRHPASGDWFTRQAARLNEAYHILKDPARRQAYDARRREALARPPAGPPAPWPRGPKMPFLFTAQLRRRLPTLITLGAVVATGLLAVALFLARPAPRPEATPLSPANPSGVGVAAPAQEEALADPRAQRLLRSPSVRRAAPEAPPQFEMRDPHLAAPSGPRPRLAQALPPAPPEPRGLERHEIDALLDEYVEAYEKGDLDRLMATLSPTVRERGTLDAQGIRSLYAKGFAGREQIIYRLKNVQVEIKGEGATVTAQYLISARNSTPSQKAVTASGHIEWKIRREGDKPKIVAINY